MKVTNIQIVIGAFDTVTRVIIKTRGYGKKDYYIIENNQNTEKSPGDLRRLAVTPTPVKDHQLMLMWKPTKSK